MRNSFTLYRKLLVLYAFANSSEGQHSEALVSDPKQEKMALFILIGMVYSRLLESINLKGIADTKRSIRFKDSNLCKEL